MEKVRKDDKLKLIDSQFKNYIDYIPANMEEIMDFIASLMHEMSIWEKSPAGKSVPQMRDEIKCCLQAEQNMDELVKQIGENNTRGEVMDKIMQYKLVFCI